MERKRILLLVVSLASVPTARAFRTNALFRAPAVCTPAMSPTICSLHNCRGSGAKEEIPLPRQSRRAAMLAFASSSLFFAAQPALSLDALISKSDPVPAGTLEPTAEQTTVIKEAIKAFDNKQLAKAESLFSQGIVTWYFFYSLSTSETFVPSTMSKLGDSST